MNRLITTNEIESVIKKLQQMKAQKQMAFAVNSTRHLKEELTTIFKISHTPTTNIEEEGKLLTSFCRSVITLIANQTKIHTKITVNIMDEHKGKNPQQNICKPIQYIKEDHTP